ncbi:hypothetical protein BP5796_06023 [Coleophoma crateriformis]|uniref:Uncharacterized protein n=1 Tax=Coleophoma crateriformis TaxID=565419 RepID=A0A3D8RWI2_9HELO|nr:hypothetical protein BP5796_06023 [Coleophoma crateriformis]
MSNETGPEGGDVPTPSMTAAAHAFQTAMQEGLAETPSPSTSALPIVPAVAESTPDVVMTNGSPEPQASPAVHAMVNGQSNGLSPFPPRNGTPSRASNGDGTPRATSQVPDAPVLPTVPVAHGATPRRYLNATVVPVLLEGMKQLAREEPEDPLRVLGEFLLQKSRELESN